MCRINNHLSHQHADITVEAVAQDKAKLVICEERLSSDF